jgi:hypothetical protein
VDGLKPTVTRLPDHLLVWESLPLKTLYLLEPTLPEGGSPVRRSPVPAAEAAAAIAMQAKLPDPLVGLATASSTLRRIAVVVRSVPVHLLQTVPDMNRLEGVARQLLAWHSAPVEHPSPVLRGEGT